MKQPLARAWWRIWPAHRYETHPARLEDVFSEVKGGDDQYRELARQLARARPFEVAQLLLKRSSENGRHQLEVYQAFLSARALYWSRVAVMCAALSLPISVLAVLVAKN